MRFRPVLLAVGLFLLVLILFFPYDSLLRWKLGELMPALQYETLEASPWSGVRLAGIRFAPAPALVIHAEEASLSPAGWTFTRWALRVKSGESRVEILLSGSPKHMPFRLTARVADLRDFAPSFPPDLRIGLEAWGEGVLSLRPFHVQEGAKITVERLSGEMPAQSRVAQAIERALGMSGWSAMWGSAVKEGRVEIELARDALAFKSISIQTAGDFTGFADLRPAWPLSAARLRVQGQASLSGRTVPIDNTIAVGDFLAAAGGS